MLVVVSPVGAGHGDVQAAVVNKAEPLQALSEAVPVALVHMVCTCHSIPALQGRPVAWYGELTLFTVIHVVVFSTR